ncbi:hypothetical protein NIES2107_44860 [Nostoc carneum NIES-2107]|nr:hypothetical protein NIES2107_44860 [Nostoc carneum NIES-2107]
MEIFTIGHSNHSIEAFMTLLQKHGITALADVRSHPYSRYLPHFSQLPLKAALVNAGISYVFLGKELGARPNDLTCYVDGKALYEKIAATQLFADGIQRLIKGAETYKIALMCAEKDPITCHRAILICQKLRSLGLTINHILSNGELESHAALEDRLLELHQLREPELPQQIQLSLFENISLPEASTMQYSRAESLHKAYHQQGEQIAYVEKTEK